MTRIHTLVASMGLSLACSMALAGEITVSAASSLTNAFKEVAQGFEAQYPGSKVQLNFAASGALLQQLAKGAPVDVLASADQETLDQAAKQGLIQPASRRDFVRNTLVLVVPAGSKLAPKSLAELAQPAYGKVAIGNPASVPVGRYTQDALEAARLWPAAECQGGEHAERAPVAGLRGAWRGGRRFCVRHRCPADGRQGKSSVYRAAG